MERDGTLLARYADTGDAGVFRELVHRYAGLVYGTCLRILRNSHDAEDTTQECFLELARKASSIKSSLAGWLHVTARNRSINTIRNKLADRRHEEEAMARNHDTDEPKWEDIVPHIDKALEDLPETLKVPVMLHYFSGLNQEQVAEELGVNQSTISRRLEKGVWELRGILKKAGILSSATLLAALMMENGSCAAPVTLMAALGKMAIAGIGAGATAAATAGGTVAVSSTTAGASSAGGAVLLGTLKAKIAALLISGAIIAGGAVAVKEAVRKEPEKQDKVVTSDEKREEEKAVAEERQWGKEVNGCRISIQLMDYDEKEYGPVTLSMIVWNVDDAVVTYPEPRLFFHYGLAVKDASDNEAPVTQYGKYILNMPEPFMRTPATLNPGRQKEYTLVVSRYYDLTPSGTYTIKAVIPLEADVDNRPVLGTSNTITLNIP